MELTLLGTGNSAGFPVYGCDCHSCETALHKGLRRTPCSALLRFGKLNLLLDAGQTQLRERFAAGELSAIFITHFHPDHVQGLFEFRWGSNLQLPVYTPPDEVGCADLYKYPGILQFQALKPFKTLPLGTLQITPVPLLHSKPTYGYVFSTAQQRLAYCTDTKGLPNETLAWFQQNPLDLLVIDCSFSPGSVHQGHNNLDDVINILKHLSVPRVVLTHIGHDFHIALNQNKYALPSNVHIGHDGMCLRLS
ncbi:phosphoribosyl 1,2-cyclic phosphate phosphodiesterase [Alteromonadaceae bacterium 2753L.S.0a.02]|nr:phosphoribosyl 1,2-cyclic phosphate phosphodiesterase [Alteromonadaceae bacterium 2753L.S.0a.02]